MKFDDFVRLNRGFDLPNQMIEYGPYPVVASTSIKAYHRTQKVKGPGVVTGRSGSLGNVQFIPVDFWPLNTTLYVKNFKGNNPRFVAYFLSAMRLENFNSGAGVPTLNQNHLHQLGIAVPNLRTQEKIAGVLAAYDDLIENNQKQIALLERMSDQLYREWFVRFRFPGHQHAKFTKGRPSEWAVQKLPQIASITYGFPFDGSKFNNSGTGRPIVRIRNVPSASTNDFTDQFADEKYLIESGDLLIGMDGEFHMNHWHSDGAYLVQRVCRLRPKNRLHSAYLYFALRGPIKHYEATIVGATVGHLGAKHLNAIDIAIPTGRAIELFEPLNNLLQQKLALARANDKLTATRSLLLPRLISGKLRVDDLGIQYPPSMQDAAA